MFTGIVHNIGAVESFKGKTLALKAAFPRQRPGDSVAVNGACLTIISAKRGRLVFEVSAETLRLTNLGALGPGARVNLEPALRLGERLGGHLVSGHVDARARVLEVKKLSKAFLRFRAELPKALRRLVALKGSIAVDGVSLTVTRVRKNYFETVLVPYTLERTTLGDRKKGDLLNLEADLIARYVRSALRGISRC